VQDDELTIGGEANVGLERLDPTGERCLEGLYGGVGAVGPTEPVRDQKR